MTIFGGRLMYQFMVGVTTPGVTRMTMTSRTNKWASRVVVILQLAAWSAVGIVLLQKGISSLQKRPDNHNVTQITPINPMHIHPPPVKDLSVIPIVDQNLQRTFNFDENPRKNDLQDPRNPPEDPFLLEPEDEPRVLESVESPLKEDKNLQKLLKAVKKRTKWEEMNISSPNSSKNSLNIEGDTGRVSDETEDLLNPETNITDRISKEESPSSSTPSSRSGVWESRRRLRLSHLSGGGAAAAVAMVAVGAVMLVLGPAVIVLRALDERRQERRFLKLSGRDDLPPSYEQATLMDEAPRYSSLSLNTILGPPPPPSPTPARAQLV